MERTHRCLKHPHSLVDMLDSVPDVASAYCWGGDGEHDIEIRSEFVVYYDGALEANTRTDALGLRLFLCLESDVERIQGEMERDGVRDRYIFYRLYQTG